MAKKLFLPQEFFFLDDFSHKELFFNAKTLWGVLDFLEEYLVKHCALGRIEGSLQEFSHIVHPELVSIGEGTIIESGAYIRGPCVIGKNCHVRQGAYFRGNVLVGDNCVVGHTTELKHSILLDQAKAAHFAFIGDSILGNSVNLGAGVKCANLRLDNQQVKIYSQGEEISTNRRKFGAVVGDNAQIGCNVVLNPGTLIGMRSKCFPCLNVGGVIPCDSIIKPIKRLYEVIHE